MFVWNDESFNISEWDEYGQNDLTQSVKRMCHGLEPINIEAIFLLVADCEFSHMVINTHKRYRKRLENRYKKLKGHLE